MQLTQEVIASYKGGQMEIQNPREGYLFRGEIADITVKNNELIVKFAWLANGEGYPPIPERWVRSEGSMSSYMNLEIYNTSFIGPDTSGGGERLCLQSPIVGEICILFTPGGSKLDPAKVEGLKLPTV